MRSILITGGAGFIGSNFVRLLMRRRPDVTVHVLDALTYAGDLDNLPASVLESDRFHFWYGDVRDREIVEQVMRQVDTVVHMAAESHVARSIYSNQAFFETDVIGTQVVATQVVRHRDRIRRFIHISTSEVYGTARTHPMTEDHPLNPTTPYASAKCGADRLVYSYIQTYGIPAVIVRPFNQYGPMQHLEKCVPRFITSALQGTPLTIHGDGLAARDFTFVTDTCQALLALLEAPLDAVVGEVINLGSGSPVSVRTLARRILELTGHDPNNDAMLRFVEDRPGQVEMHVSSTDKARRLLGWQATTSLDEGLMRTIEWYRENEPWWRRRLWMRHVPITTPTGQTVMH